MAFPGRIFSEAGTGFGQIVLTEDKLRELDAKGWELYDLSADPTETNNLAETRQRRPFAALRKTSTSVIPALRRVTRAYGRDDNGFLQLPLPRGRNVT
jgi:hypothetical protein